ncbi:hypothetical protein AVEN_118540-1 [Araneus ventricosus]|uniref:Uncharacterized protein n=1 Tax=Araneus ventricosus TaxID=182803 RepID=A0A4Y2AVN7_ARAVE|nr:hypothetical protein AVEN_118540-1 [Araneus ventricosus]
MLDDAGSCIFSLDLIAFGIFIYGMVSKATKINRLNVYPNLNPTGRHHDVVFVMSVNKMTKEKLDTLIELQYSTTTDVGGELPLDSPDVRGEPPLDSPDVRGEPPLDSPDVREEHTQWIGIWHNLLC